MAVSLSSTLYTLGLLLFCTLPVFRGVAIHIAKILSLFNYWPTLKSINAHHTVEIVSAFAAFNIGALCDNVPLP